MSIQIVLQGTVTPDGTLELDDRLKLPAGRVQVMVQPLPQPSAQDPFWARMEAIWSGQEARGHVPREKEAIDAELRELRTQSEEEMRGIDGIKEDADD